MTGKAPSGRSRKDKPRSSRPYDRPDQSLLGKVASRVKQCGSWLLNVSSWVRTNAQEASSDDPPETAEADLTENDEEPETSQASVRARLSGLSHAKRPRLDRGENSTITTEVPHWLGPLDTNENFAQTIPKSTISPDCSQIVQDCESSRKETPIVVNGDDHSENSDGSASTSGCSSLVSSQDKPHRSSGLKLSDSAVESLQREFKWKQQFQRPRKEAATITSETLSSSHNMSRNLSLWSCSMQSPAKSPQMPSLLNSSRPSFSVASLASSTPGTSAGNKTSSPFYEGATTFGGASAYRRRPMSNTPYQYNPQKPAQVKVKENMSSSDYECMSSAAKRILYTLENMSTPITDAKKIPNISRSPLDVPSSVTLPSQRLKPYLSTPQSTHSLRGPPVVNLKTVSKLTLLKNHQSRVKSPMLSLPLKEQSIIPLPEESSSVSKPQETSSVTVSSKMTSGGGKMKSKLRESLHASVKSRETEEDIPEYDLPCVPLPISNKLPTLSFNTGNIPKKVDSLTKDKVPEKEKESKSQPGQPQFIFSSPISHIPPTNNIHAESSMENQFKFSTPLVVTQTSSSSPPTEQEEAYSNRSLDEILKSVTAESTPKVTHTKMVVENKSDFEKEKTTTTASSSAPTTFGLKTSVAATSTTGFGDAFKPKPGTWTCKDCYLMNDQSRQTCAACECPKVPTQSAGKSTNVSSIANVTSRPETKTDTSKELPSSSFVPKPSSDTSWECDTCSVRNPVNRNRCTACDTLKLCQEKPSGSFNSTFKFSADDATSVASTSTFGSFTTTASTFKLGVTDESKPASMTSNAFTFGNAAPAGPVMFGGAAVPNKTLVAKSEEKKEADKPTSGIALFNFGSATPASKSNDVSAAESKPATTLSFAAGEPLSTTTTTASFKPGDFTNFQPKRRSTSNLSASEFGVSPLSNSFEKSKDVSNDSTGGTKEKPLGAFTANYKFGAPPAAAATASETPFKFGSTTTTTVPISTFNFGDTPVTTNAGKTNLATSGFTFGNTIAPVGFGNSTAVTKPFGDKSEKKKDNPVGNPMFVFGGTSTTTNEVPQFNKPVTTTASSISTTLLPSNSDATFTPSGFSGFQPPASTTASSAFGSTPFGKPQVSVASSIQKSNQPVGFGMSTTTASPVFAFGTPSNFASSTVAFTNTLGAKPAEATSNINAAKASPFSFGTAKTEVKPTMTGGFAFNTPKEDKVNFMTSAQPPAPSSFGMLNKQEPAAVSASNSLFNFGSAKPAPPNNAFVFGGTTKTDTNTAGQFSFGSAPKPVNFGGFQQTQPTAVTSSIPTFNFGGSSSTAFNPAGTAAPAYALVNKGNQGAVLNAQPAVAPPAFGSQMSQPMFGGNTSSVPAFGTPASAAFGSPAAAATQPSFQTPKPETSGGFNFNPQQPASNLFSFSAQPQVKKVTPNPSQGGFQFNMLNQVDPNFQSPGFNITAPSSFNFGATPPPTTQLFQFAASSDTGSSSSTRKIRKAIRRRKQE